MPNPNNDRLHELLEKSLDRQMSESEHAELDQLLIDRPEARQAYLDLVVLDSYLELEHRSQEELQSLKDVHRPGIVSWAIRRTGQFFARPTPISVTVAAVVIGVFLTALAFTAAPMYHRWRAHEVATEPPPAESNDIATMTGMRDAVWRETEAMPKTQLGQTLRGGDLLELNEGFAQITYHNGACVILEAPCAYELTSQNSGRLEYGKLSVRLGEGAQGFQLKTPNAHVIDLGTEFGVYAAGNDRTDVTVFSGVVNVSLEGSQQLTDPLRLTAGQSAHVGDDKITIVQSSLREFAPSRFVRALPGPLVEEASCDTGFPVFISEHGLRDGALAYSDEPHVWTGLSSELEGYSYIRTPNANRHEESFRIELNLARPARLYLICNNRRQLPEWVTAESGYTPTNLTAQLATRYADGRRTEVDFSVWTREVNEAGNVTLGPTRGNGGGVFGIVVAPLTKKQR